MIIYPAIDIKDGRCVRLIKGDFSTAHQVAENPFLTAQSFAAQGARWLHMVDLDGALEGKRVNGPMMMEIIKNLPLKVEVGGGIRTMKTVEYYLENGISRVIIGSAAVENPQLLKDAVDNYGDRVAVGIDAKNRMVATRGWVNVSEIDFIELAKRVEQNGVKYIIFTDVSKDGTLMGPSVGQLTELKNAVSCQIIASGGIKDVYDIEQLVQAGINGAICGKALYAKTLSLLDAIGKAGDQDAG